MELPLTISQAQLTEMIRPRQEKQRNQMLLKMEAFWKLNEGQWHTRLVYIPRYEDMRFFFRQVYDWGAVIGLSKGDHFVSVGVLLLRAVYQGWPPEDISMAQKFVEANIEEPELAIKWLLDAMNE